MGLGRPTGQPPGTSRRPFVKGGIFSSKRGAAPRHEAPKKIPSLGGVARSDSGREAPGWVRSLLHNPPLGLTALAPPWRGFDAIFVRRSHRALQRCGSSFENSLWIWGPPRTMVNEVSRQDMQR